jgi:aldose 1-epimerase
MKAVALRNAHLHAQILPQTGAGLARLDWIGGGTPVPLLRTFDVGASAIPGSPPPRVNQLGCFVLVPWSNRMAGGFAFDGRFHPIAPNREGDPLPIHGEGWQFPWQVEQASDSEATLVLERRGTPFSFDARIRYALVGQALEVSLGVTNRGQQRLPFGLGLHPYLPRTEGVTLQARAETLWLPGPDKLPVRAQAVPSGWSFEQARSLPPEVIDHVFEGWDGLADVHWPERGLSMTIESDARYYIVYTPAGADFFCFEPVDHRIDAHNGEGGPERHGLTVLAPGQALDRSFRFSVR